MIFRVENVLSIVPTLQEPLFALDRNTWYPNSVQKTNGTTIQMYIWIYKECDSHGIK